jgi:hypothetical protein
LAEILQSDPDWLFYKMQISDEVAFTETIRSRFTSKSRVRVRRAIAPKAFGVRRELRREGLPLAFGTVHRALKFRTDLTSELTC